MSVNSMTPTPQGGAHNPADGPAEGPWKDDTLDTTQNGTSIDAYLDESTYFGYSSDDTVCEQCLLAALKSGGTMALGPTRLGGQEAAQSAYVDGWQPAGAGAVSAELPRLNLFSLPDPNGVRIYEGGGTGTLAFDQNNVPQAELSRSATKTPTYFTTYDQRKGIYFEYFGGSGLPSSDARFGRVNRRYDTKGNQIQYNYANNASGKALLRSLTGDIAGSVLPYYYYADETLDATHFAPITKLALLDTANPANTRTVYYEYASYTAPSGTAYPYLSKVINPNGCVQLYDPTIPFNTLGGDTTAAYQIKHDVDSEGYQTYFTYSGLALTQVAQPEGRIVYYEYLPTGETHQIPLGRPKRIMTYSPSTFGGHIPLVTKDSDALGNTTYFGYNNLALARMTQAIQPNGNLTYFQYVGSGQNQYAMSLLVSAFNNAQTYFGYSGTYDLVKQVGPRWTAGTSVEVTYYAYDAARNRTAKIDALGNQTLYGRDSLGRLIRQQDAKGNVTTYNYSPATGSLDSHADAAGNVTYYGYNSFLNRTAEVSKRWIESNFQAFSTYYEYDQLNRRAKTVDAQGNVTYFDWTNRGNPLDTVDALGTVTSYTYNGLRLQTQTSVADRGGVLLSKTQDGYDIYKNRVQSLDGRGNPTYFFYDAIDRLTAMKDALGNTTYYFYDSKGNRTVVTDSRNDSIYYFYDLLSRKTCSRDALADATYFFYDLANNQTSMVDPRGNPIYFFYDALDRRQAVLDALGDPTYFFYDPVGNQSVVMNARFASTYYGYDSLNRRTAMQDALANTTYYAFDAAGNTTKVTDARSNATTSTYDTLNRLSVTMDALSDPTYFGYDAVGNRLRSMDARFNPIYYFYDGLRRQTVTKDALADLTYYFYDLAGNRTVLVNPRAAATYFGYDALNRRSQMQDALANTTYYAYDPVGNQARVIDARSNASTFAYDALNRMSTMADALANTTYYAYDQVGNQVRMIDARSNASTIAYDALNRPSATADALADAAYFFYDSVGNRTRIQNPRQAQTYFAYDLLNRNTAMQDALGNVTYFTYDQVGNRTKVTDARQNSTTTTYDALNRKSVLADALGNTLLFQYDQVGNLIAQGQGGLGYGLQPYGISPYGGVTAVSSYFFYDQINRRTAALDPLNNPTYYFYDPANNRTALKNPLFHTAYFGYDLLNRLVRMQDPTASTTYFVYDPVGNVTAVIDPDTHQTLTQFDALSRVSAVRYADSGSAYFAYDPVSSRTRSLDQRGSATYFGYDAVSRLTQIQDALGKTVYFQYDAASNATKFIDAETASSAFTYDLLNRMTNIAFAAAGAVVSDGLGAAPYFVYDPVGNMTQMGDLWGLHRWAYDPVNRASTHQYPGGSVVYYQYDPRSNVTARVYPGASGSANATYDSLDRQTRLQAPSGAATYFTYDAASNLTQRLLGDGVGLLASYDPAERVQTWRYSKSNSAPLTYFDYSRDQKGLITKAVREANYSVYYTYDACDRLMSEVWASGSSEVYGFRYAYDLAGNRTQARVNGSNTYYSYDLANQLTIKGTTALFANATYYTYDKNGSLTDLAEPSGTTKFGYNAAGLVAKMRWKDASSTYFFYDGGLRRYAINTNGTLNYFLWDGMDLLQEQNADGTVKEEYTQAKVPVPGIGQLVEVNRPGQAQAKLYPVMDPRGTVTKYVQSDGTTVFASREYDAFGNLIPNSSTGTWPGIFGYQGQAWQEILSANGAQRLLLSPTRLYDPVDGKFLSRDPLRLRDPKMSPIRVAPLYLYVGQNPVLSVDPTGRETWQQIHDHVLDAMGNVVDGPSTAGGFGGGVGELSPLSLWFNPLAFNPLAFGGPGAALAFVGNLINSILGIGGISFGCGQGPMPGYFIAVGAFTFDIPIVNLVYNPGHLSLELWYQDTLSMDEGYVFDTNTPPGGAQIKEAIELLGEYPPFFMTPRFMHWYVKSDIKPVMPKRWAWGEDDVSWISHYPPNKDQAQLNSAKSAVIYVGQNVDLVDAYSKFQAIKAAADDYQFAELNRNDLNKWPNSKYELTGNNSNAFVKTMSQQILYRDPLNYVSQIGSFPGNYPPEQQSPMPYKPNLKTDSTYGLDAPNKPDPNTYNGIHWPYWP